MGHGQYICISIDIHETAAVAMQLEDRRRQRARCGSSCAQRQDAVAVAAGVRTCSSCRRAPRTCGHRAEASVCATPSTSNCDSTLTRALRALWTLRSTRSIAALHAAMWWRSADAMRSRQCNSFRRELIISSEHATMPCVPAAQASRCLRQHVSGLHVVACMWWLACEWQYEAVHRHWYITSMVAMLTLGADRGARADFRTVVKFWCWSVSCSSSWECGEIGESAQKEEDGCCHALLVRRAGVSNKDRKTCSWML